VVEATASELGVGKRKRRQQVAALMDRGKSRVLGQPAAVGDGKVQATTNDFERVLIRQSWRNPAAVVNKLDVQEVPSSGAVPASASNSSARR
jgi:hypothetical protein